MSILIVKVATPLDRPRRIDKTLVEALIEHSINLLIIAHTPFEEATIKLRYHLSTVAEDSLIIWWSKRVKKWIEELKKSFYLNL
jgi:hypothetical protein